MIVIDPDASARAPDLGPRFKLRAATAAAHARLDALYCRLDLSDRGDYARFLLSHAAAFIPVETALSEADADALLPGWSARRRGDALRADLADFGLGSRRRGPVRALPTKPRCWAGFTC